MKFKVGDKVRALPSADCEGYNGANTSMLEGEIVGINDSGLDREPMIRLKIIYHEYLQYIGKTYLVKAKHFELIESPQSIHITQAGDTIHAVLKEGTKLVRRSKAVCSSNDTFDFATGVQLALERLFEQNQEIEGTPDVHKPPTKKGDIIQVGDDIPVDTLVEVWDVGGQQKIRRFAGFVPEGGNGSFFAFSKGKSSKSSSIPTKCWWLHAALAEDLPTPEEPMEKRYFSLKKYMKWRERIGECSELTIEDGGWVLKCAGQEVIDGLVQCTNGEQYGSSPTWETTKPPKEKLYFDKDLYFAAVYRKQEIPKGHWAFHLHGRRVKKGKIKGIFDDSKIKMSPDWCTTTKPAEKSKIPLDKC